MTMIVHVFDLRGCFESNQNLESVIQAIPKRVKAYLQGLQTMD